MDYNLKKLIEQKVIWPIHNKDGIGYEYISEERLKNRIYKRLLMKLLSNEIDEKTFFKTMKKLESMDIDEIQI